jgi:hypothetical protein
MTRELRLELIAPRETIDLVTIDMDVEVNETEVFAGIRDNVGEKPPAMSYFRATDPGGKKYDIAMLFTSDYLNSATPAQLQVDYQLVTTALVKLVTVLNEGGFNRDHN